MEHCVEKDSENSFIEKVYNDRLAMFEVDVVT